MSIGYNIAEKVIIIEFTVVSLIILFTYILKFIYFLREKNKNKIIFDVKNYLTEKIAKNNNKIDQQFFKNKQRLDVLIGIIYSFDNTFKNTIWDDLRKRLIEFVILPVARKSAMSHSWVLRCLSAEAFTLLSYPEDEPLLIKLASDKVPLVFLNALNAALTCGSEKTINIIITKMAKERKLTQSIYIQAFANIPLKSNYIIENRLKSDNDPYVRSICYTILLNYPPIPITWNSNTDIQSSNKELKLSSIRFMAHSKKASSIPDLINLLTDKLWEARLVAIQCLGELKAIDAIPYVALCLRDSEWWVRLNAAKALKNMGKPGIAILKTQDPAIDRFAYEASQHVLAI